MNSEETNGNKMQVEPLKQSEILLYFVISNREFSVLSCCHWLPLQMGGDGV